MIDHTGIAVSDFGRSIEFYQRALKPLGYSICLQRGKAAGFGTRSPDQGNDPDRYNIEAVCHRTEEQQP